MCQVSSSYPANHTTCYLLPATVPYSSTSIKLVSQKLFVLSHESSSRDRVGLLNIGGVRVMCYHQTRDMATPMCGYYRIRSNRYQVLRVPGTAYLVAASTRVLESLVVLV